MRFIAVGALLLATTAASAGAQVGFSAINGAPDQGFPGQTLLVNFNGASAALAEAAANAAGVTFANSFSLPSGTVPGAAAPAGVTDRFFATPDVGGASSGTATIDFQGFLATQTLASLSFYWGSMDSYNTLEALDESMNPILFSNGSLFLTGNNVANPAPANGNRIIGDTNRRVFLDLVLAPEFRALRLTSTNRAFEIDDIAVSSLDRATVPEPATASVLALGLAMLGAAGARRKRNTV